MTDISFMFLGGTFNQTYLGVPYYGWIITFMIMLGMVVAALFYFFLWLKLKPYHGIFMAHLKNTGASNVFDENQHFDLITDRSAKVIFNESFREAQDAEGDTAQAQTATIGKVHMDFIFDPDKWTYPTTEQHKKIEDIAERWNELNPTNQIRTLLKFSQYLTEGRFDQEGYDTFGLRRYYTVPWARVRMMYADRVEGGVFGFVMSLASLIQKAETEMYNQYAILILGFCGLLDIILIIMWFITRKG